MDTSVAKRTGRSQRGHKQSANRSVPRITFSPNTPASTQKRKMLKASPKRSSDISQRWRLDTRYKEFDLFLEMPKTVKESKRITERIVTIEDIKNVLSAIDEDKRTLSLRRDSAKTKRPLCCSAHTQATSLCHHPQTYRRAVSGRSTARPLCLMCCHTRTKSGWDTMCHYTPAL